MKNWWFIGLRRYPAPCEMLPVRLTRPEREYSESGASLAAARHSFIVAEAQGRGNLHVSRCLCLMRMLVYIEGEIFTISNKNEFLCPIWKSRNTKCIHCFTLDILRPLYGPWKVILRPVDKNSTLCSKDTKCIILGECEYRFVQFCTVSYINYFVRKNLLYG